MLKYSLFFLFYLFHLINVSAQSDHAEATGYIDYFIATYNGQEVRDNDVVVSDGAFINNNDVFLDYKVRSNSEDVIHNEKDLYEFVEEKINNEIAIESFELQVFAINYDLVMSYYFEDNYCLIIEKSANQKVLARYYDQNHNILTELSM